MNSESKIRPSVVMPAHAYTRSDAPWLLEAYSKKLFHYLSGGGISAFGRTVKQQEADMRRDRFLRVAAAVFVIWLVLLLA